jgi:hypothetical protein
MPHMMLQCSPHLAIVPPEVAQALAGVRVVQRQRDAIHRRKVLAAIAEGHILASLDGHLQ